MIKANLNLNLNVPTDTFRLSVPFKHIDLTHSSGVSFSIELRCGVVFIYGDVVSGNTLFYNTLMDAKLRDRGRFVSDSALNRVTLFNYTHTLPMIESLKLLKGNLIVIDNFDFIRRECPEIIDYINDDFSNQYLLIGGVLKGLELNSGSVAKMCVKDNQFSLYYL